jgi:hypothetical protein
MKIKTTTEKEIEVTFPTYRKSEVHYWKVISPDQCLVIVLMNNNCQIESSPYPDLAYTIGDEDSTQEEFELKYKIALNRLNKMLNQREIEPIYNDNNQY